MRRFFIDKNKVVGSAAPLAITGPDAKHIAKVLRLKPGDRIGLFDGAGSTYEASILDVSPTCVNVSVLRSLSLRTESPVQITIAQALLKEKKMDTLVRQLTELGMAVWAPFLAARSVPRPDQQRLAARKVRWEKIAQEAVKQCEKGCVPEIRLPVLYEAILTAGREYDVKVVFWEKESRPLSPTSASIDQHVRTVLLVLGPEGGFTSREIETAKTYGFQTVSLGPRILRSETAAVAACTLAQYIFGDLGQKSLDKDRRF
jgi:16S rRNA (uracil1498-N3)-methyltransferase